MDNQDWNMLDYEDLGIRPFQWDRDLNDKTATTASMFINDEKEEYTYDLTVGSAEFSASKKSDENNLSENEECERDPETGEKIFSGHLQDVVPSDENLPSALSVKWLEDYFSNIETNLSPTSLQLLPISSEIDNKQEDKLSFPTLSSDDINWFNDLLNDQGVYDPESTVVPAITLNSYMFDSPNMMSISPTPGFLITNTTTYSPNQITTTTNEQDQYNRRRSIIESVEENLISRRDSNDTINSLSAYSRRLSKQYDNNNTSSLMFSSAAVENSRLSLSSEYETDLPSNNHTIPLHLLDNDSTTSDSGITFDENSKDHQRIQTKIEPFDDISSISTEESNDRRILHAFRTSTRSKRQRDEETLRRYNIQMSLNEVTQFSTEDYNKRLSEMIFTNEQLQVIKDIRRRGKNKVAAQNCRKRKAVNVESLLEEVDELKRVKITLEEKRKTLGEQIMNAQLEYETLYKQYLPSKKMPPLAILTK